MKIRQSKSDIVFCAVNGAILTLIFCVILYPMIYVVSASLSEPKLVNAGKVFFFPQGFTLLGYRRILAYHDIWIGYGNTFFYTLVGTVLNLAVTLPCAYALSRRDVPGRAVVSTLFLITMYFGGGLIPAYLNVQSMGLVNTRLILLISGLVSAYNVFVSRTFFSTTIPHEMEEAACVDGCTDFTTFFRLILPLSKPIVVVMALYYGVGHWNGYFTAMIYLRDKALYPLQLFLRDILVQGEMSVMLAAETQDPEALALMSEQAEAADLIKYGVIVVSTLPMMILYPWLQKFFAKGVMIGAVKG